MTSSNLTRRRLLQGAGAIGCSGAIQPLFGSMVFAAAPGPSRLVVLILRGGMDGLDVVRPVGDVDFAPARPGLRGKSLELDGFFALHPALGDLMPLWKAQELAFVHAVSTPYRDKRSHFDGQDILEAGSGGVTGARDGWLNRLLQNMPGSGADIAFGVGRENLKILSGDAPVSNWAPNTHLDLSDQAQALLLELYHGDPLFRDAATEAIELAGIIARDRDEDAADNGMMQQMMRDGGGRSERALAAFAADRMNHDTRIVSFSINGWDTHRNQVSAIKRPLSRLSEVILTLKQGLGENWGNTTVIAMTEFGRTARENGTGGTDHGTGGAMLLAGGAIRGGRVYANWPGLSEVNLYQRRDLMATGDVRAFAAWAIRGLFGLDRAALEGSVFPGLDLGDDPGIIL